MKVSSSISPLAFTLETNPRRPSFRLVRFHENAKKIENGWEYDEYCAELPASETLEADVETHYYEYLRRAMEAEGASDAEFVQAARNAALRRIEGKCSAAIYSGVTVDGKHYKLTPTAQSNLATAKTMVDAGATGVIYAADGEGPSLHTAAQVTAISTAAYEWGVVNTSYYAALVGWISSETDTAVLLGINYGSSLPAERLKALGDLLASAGIDLSKYTSALSA